MPAIPLPDRPSLENLRNRAKTLQQLLRSGDEGALAVVREFHPRLGALTRDDSALAGFSRTDAQLVIARQHGFASWNRLRKHLEIIAQFSRSPHRLPPGTAVNGPQELADEFLRLACLIYDGYDPARIDQAQRILAEHPEVAAASVYTSAAAGEFEHLSVLLRSDPGLARREGGPFRWAPLMYAAYSRIDSPQPGRSTLEAARRLLAAGADPNAGYLWDGLPSAFTVLTGAFGRGEGAPPPHPQAMELATVLLEAGADPNDSQALYNCSLQSPPDDDGYLRLLLRYGLGTGSGGPWYARSALTRPCRTWRTVPPPPAGPTTTASRRRPPCWPACSISGPDWPGTQRCGGSSILPGDDPVISGLSRKSALLSPGAKLLGRTYYLALTDQHLVFCWISTWSGKPAEVSIVAPREQVKVISSRLGGQMGWIVCQVPGREARMTLRFHRFWRPEIESLLSALSADRATGSDSRQ